MEWTSFKQRRANRGARWAEVLGLFSSRTTAGRDFAGVEQASGAQVGDAACAERWCSLSRRRSQPGACPVVGSVAVGSCRLQEYGDTAVPVASASAGVWSLERERLPRVRSSAFTNHCGCWIWARILAREF